MENKSGMNREVLRRTRKVMLLLPVVLIPLLCIGFYALGGGQGDKKNNGVQLTKGLNMSLPEAKFDTKKKGLNKLGFYKQSEQDSIRLREKRKMDPYYGFKDSGAGVSAAGGGVRSVGTPGGLTLEPGATDAQAGDLLQKLDQLKGMLSRQEQGAISDAPLPARLPGRPVLPATGLPVAPAVPFGGASARVGPGDPDLDKLNTLMDKVLKIRYPGDPPLIDSGTRDTTRAMRESLRVQLLTVPVPEEMMTTLPAEDKEDLATGFIDLGEEPHGDSLAEMIAAVVDGAQTLISGEAVSLRTAGDAVLGGTRIPRGTPLSGKATLSGERLLMTVNAVRIGSRVIPVSLEVVDMDGMAGIRVKGSINRDVSKESASEAVGSLGVTSLDPSVAGQATAAGIQAAKNLLGRKIRQVRVGLPSGYHVFLRNNTINH